MTTKKNNGKLPPLAVNVGVRPLTLNSENGHGILSYRFPPSRLNTVLNSIPSSQDGNGCWESDHDFEEALSPAASSTASGPIYERPPGFKTHAHSIRADKPNNLKIKGIKLASLVKDGGKKKEAPSSGGAKRRGEKVSTPMKDRPFPRSFFKEPNKTNPVLPPIRSQPPVEVNLDVNVNNLSIDQDEIPIEESAIPKVVVSSESDQLTDKLFDCVNKESKFTKRKPGKPVDVETYNPGLSGRGDPYLVQNIREKLSSSSSVTQLQTLQIIRSKGERELPFQLPTLAVRNPYAQTLKEIIEQL